MTTSTKPAQPATPLPHLTATGLFISYTGSFGAQRVAECSEEYAAAEIARRTNAYPRLLAFAGCSMAQIEAGAAPYQQINGWLNDAIAERDSLRAELEDRRSVRSSACFAGSVMIRGVKHISPAIGEFAVQDAVRLRAENARLSSALERATNMRPALLMTLGYVPEPVLEYCNDVRDTLKGTT